MELTIEAALKQGVSAHKEGKHQDAERFYRAILQAQPAHPDANHNLGLLAVNVNKIEAALPFFKIALDENPNIEQFWMSYIDALIKINQFKDARRVIKQGKLQGVNREKLKSLESQLRLKKQKLNAEVSSPERLLENLAEHRQAGRNEEVERLAVFITQKFPKYQLGWKVLAAALRQAGKISESLVPSQKSVQLEPRDADALIDLGNTFKQLDRLIEAEVSYKKAIALQPDSAEAHCNLGVTLTKLGRLEEAETSYARALALKPDLTEVHNNFGIMLRAQGRLDEAEVSFKQAIALKPDYAEAYNNLGNMFRELERSDEAEDNYNRAIALKPDYASVHNNFGIMLRAQGRFDEAEERYTRAIALRPDYAAAHNNLGVMLQGLGRFDEAEASYTNATVFKPDDAEAHRHLALMKKFEIEDEQFSKMTQIYLDKNTSEEQRCTICFGLAKACEDLGNYKQAFIYYSEGNELRKKLLNYDISEDVAMFKQIKSNYPWIEKNSLEPEKLSKNLVPIFIVGMPRSGTTLTEQIISSHPQVTGAGELPFLKQFGAAIANGSAKVNSEALHDFRHRYLEKLRVISNRNLFVTDKMPQNFRYLGLVAAAFPEAKIIHVKRNPAAVCWANYKYYFVSKSISYCYALRDVLRYHELYLDLME